MLATLRFIAIGLPNVTEGSHPGGLDFRVGGRVFAAIADADRASAILHLGSEAQFRFCALDPYLFAPAPDAGGHGTTRVQLNGIDEEALRSALEAAWRHVSGATMAPTRRAGVPVAA